MQSLFLGEDKFTNGDYGQRELFFDSLGRPQEREEACKKNCLFEKEKFPFFLSFPSFLEETIFPFVPLSTEPS